MQQPNMLLTSPNGKPKLVTNQVTYPARICSAPGLKKLDKNVMLDTAKPQETLLEVNNVEVIYNHVILVLKGVSLQVPKAALQPCLVEMAPENPLH